MAFKTTSAFVAGVATGWVLRSTLGSSREALVRVIVVAHRGRERLKRVVAENAEWLDDLFAEGRARYDGSQVEVPLDDEAPPVVSPAEHAA
ncbi:MAG TPA: hypothetical protein VNW92_14940 [Polyangiaceae bacterium]|jgi:hypothetical protein|nr:hypothetical protein [Polyangiaceae bacterium]